MITLPSRLIASAVAKHAQYAVKRAVKNASPKIRSTVEALIVAEAYRTPHGKRYERELKKPGILNEQDGKLILKLEDPLLRAIEYGSTSFDIKPGLLAKGKPSKKGGTYADVPFVHDLIPRGFQKQLTLQARVRSKTPGQRFRKTIHTDTGSKRIRVSHKQGIHDDMLRGGVTIRRVSSRSAPSSWIHPGFKGLNVIEKVSKVARNATQRILIDALNDVGILVKK